MTSETRVSRPRRPMRRIVPLTLIAFFVFVASAQAHNLSAATSCTPSGNVVNMHWYNFSSPPGPFNGGYNTPTWTITYTPAGGGAATTLNGSVKFNTPTYDLTPAAAIPSGAGTVAASSTWGPATTSDGAAPTTVTIPLSVPNCPHTITTTASALGATITDRAVVTGVFNPPTGTVTFNLYGPSDPTCSGTPLTTVTASTFTNPTTTPNPGGPTIYGGTFTSPAVAAPTTPGTYNWVASYSGDASNAGSTEACGTASEQVIVPPAPPPPPSITTMALKPTPSTTTDLAVLSGGTSPTGTITFNLYGPGDATCARAPIATSTVTVHGDGTYASTTATLPGSGSYSWTASYSGDASNPAVAEGCGQPPETIPGFAVTPGFATTASHTCTTVPMKATCTISDKATVSGGSTPTTGTITFKLYGPTDATCSKAALETVKATVTGDGAYATPSFTLTTTASGTYNWVATFNGTSAGTPVTVTEPCGTAAEQAKVVVPPCKCSSPHGTLRLLGSSLSNLRTVLVSAPGVKSITLSIDGTKYATMTKAANGHFSLDVVITGQLRAARVYTTRGPASTITWHVYHVTATVTMVQSKWCRGYTLHGLFVWKVYCGSGCG